MQLPLWEDCVITDIRVAVYVPPNSGQARHRDRPAHGFVLNDPDVERQYLFDDGFTLPTGPGQLFYLPRGSSYRVITEGSGGCYAINFGTLGEWADEPFRIRFRDPETVRRAFAEAAQFCAQKPPFWRDRIRAILYDTICRMSEEMRRSYLPSAAARRLLPAEEIIARRYTDPSLTVRELAAACGVSEAYFRRLFSQIHATNPAAYVASLRLERAKELLGSGQLTVTQTAEVCGYGDPAYFSREFRRRTGQSPVEYKKHPKGERS